MVIVTAAPITPNLYMSGYEMSTPKDDAIIVLCNTNLSFRLMMK